MEILIIICLLALLIHSYGSCKMHKRWHRYFEKEAQKNFSDFLTAVKCGESCEPERIYYLVRILYGGTYNWAYLLVFVTPDEAKADAWKAKYNRIISENEDRMKEYWEGDLGDEEPYQSEFIHFQNPKAVIHMIEKR